MLQGEAGSGRGVHAPGHPSLHGARGAGPDAEREGLRGVQTGRHVLTGAGLLGDRQTVREEGGREGGRERRGGRESGGREGGNRGRIKKERINE